MTDRKIKTQNLSELFSMDDAFNCEFVSLLIICQQIKSTFILNLTSLKVTAE